MIFWSINTFGGGKRSPKLYAELSDHRCIFDQNYQHIGDVPKSFNFTKKSDKFSDIHIFANLFIQIIGIIDEVQVLL